MKRGPKQRVSRQQPPTKREKERELFFSLRHARVLSLHAAARFPLQKRILSSFAWSIIFFVLHSLPLSFFEALMRSITTVEAIQKACVIHIFSSSKWKLFCSKKAKITTNPPSHHLFYVSAHNRRTAFSFFLLKDRNNRLQLHHQIIISQPFFRRRAVKHFRSESCDFHIKCSLYYYCYGEKSCVIA